MAPEDRSDLADDPWLIVVADDQHRSAERRLDIDAAERDETQAVRLEHGSLDPAFATVGVQLDREQVREVSRPRAAGLDDVDAALTCGGPGVHHRDAARENRPQRTAGPPRSH